jgi:hypothetical protein
MNSILGSWVDCSIAYSLEVMHVEEHSVFDAAPRHELSESGLHKLVSSDGDMDTDGRYEFPSPITNYDRRS